jgi:preprotein translocase subunit SecY
MTNLLSAVLGLSFAAGLNAYATVLALGLLDRLGVVHLPPSLHMVSTIPVILAAAFMFLVEFIADKIPWFDSFWDGIHTVIRPAAGALLAYGVVGNVDPQWQVIAALAGGSIALTAHTAKASTRAAANVSPEPFSNWVLSLAEDAISFFVVWLTVTHPVVGLTIVLILLSIAVLIVWKLSQFARRVFRKAS